MIAALTLKVLGRIWCTKKSSSVNITVKEVTVAMIRTQYGNYATRSRSSSGQRAVGATQPRCSDRSFVRPDERACDVGTTICSPTLGNAR